MNKGFLVVEGHGEIDAARLLVDRLWRDLNLPAIHWEKPIRAARGSLLHRITVEKMCNLLRSQKKCDVALILRDADDDCPATSGPLTASWIEQSNLPFPTAVVLARREFEAWFLPCMKIMAGKQIRDGLQLQTNPTWKGDPEEVRGAKEKLTEHLYPKHKAYKESVDQAALVQLIDFSLLRSTNVRSFGTLERALKFLAAPNDSNVYPPPVLPMQPQATTARKL